MMDIFSRLLFFNPFIYDHEKMILIQTVGWIDMNVSLPGSVSLLSFICLLLDSSFGPQCGIWKKALWMLRLEETQAVKIDVESVTLLL